MKEAKKQTRSKAETCIIDIDVAMLALVKEYAARNGIRPEEVLSHLVAKELKGAKGSCRRDGRMI